MFPTRSVAFLQLSEAKVWKGRKMDCLGSKAQSWEG